MLLLPAFSGNAARAPVGLGGPALPADPQLAMPFVLEPVPPTVALEVQVPAGANDNLEQAAIEPLDPARSLPNSRQHRWKLVTAISCALHAAVALAFLAAPDAGVSIEGGEQAGIVLFGNAADDQAASGVLADPNTTQVTIVTVLQPRQVETVTAEPVAADAAETVDDMRAETTWDAASAVETAPASKSFSYADPVTPDRHEAISANLSPEANLDIVEPADLTIQTPASAVAELVESAEVLPPAETKEAAAADPVKATTVPPTSATVADPEPDILAAQVVGPDDNGIDRQGALAADAADPVVSDYSLAAVSAESQVEPVPDPQPDPTVTVRSEPAQTTDVTVAEAVTSAAPISARETRPAQDSPEMKPEKVKPAKNAKRPKREERSPKPSESRESAKQPKPSEKREASKSKAGSGGRNTADSKRGGADGRADGNAAQAGKAAGSSAAGNAAVSNYPGKVATRLRRAAGGISSAARARARKDVRVSFVVTASGGVASVRIAQSSGSAELDAAAVATVRRAAPFPPIPPEAGRSSWPFTVPLGLAR